MVNDVIGGHVTSKFLNILCKFFLLSSKNMRRHLFVKYVKTKLRFGPNGRKIVKIYHRGDNQGGGQHVEYLNNSCTHWVGCKTIVPNVASF